MKYTRLFTGEDNKSHFEDIEADGDSVQELGHYSKKYPVKHMMFREMMQHAFFNWHNAPRTQYIVYLEGEAEVIASDGEKRIFKTGDVLLADDLTGEGHTSHILRPGRSLVVEVGE